jgi:GST-like protein
MDRQLAHHPFMAGRQYTVADIAIFPWLRSWQNQGVQLSDYPNVERWLNGIAARPAVQRGVQVLADLRKPLVDDKAREALFGNAQYQRR